MKSQYIVMGFGADENYMLGYFLCQPVNSKAKDPKKISFDDLAQVNLYFDPELLCYILEIDDADILPPYEVPTIDNTVPSGLGWFDTNN